MSLSSIGFNVSSQLVKNIYILFTYSSLTRWMVKSFSPSRYVFFSFSDNTDAFSNNRALIFRHHCALYTRSVRWSLRRNGILSNNNNNNHGQNVRGGVTLTNANTENGGGPHN